MGEWLNWISYLMMSMNMIPKQFGMIFLMECGTMVTDVHSIETTLLSHRAIKHFISHFALLLYAVFGFITLIPAKAVADPNRENSDFNGIYEYFVKVEEISQKNGNYAFPTWKNDLS